MLELGFIGFGLIGGSIAKSLKKRGADIRVLVYSRRKNPDLLVGCEEGVIDKIVYEIDESFSSCNIIFLCAPVKRIIDLLPDVKRVASPSCIITDVGSVKGEICQAAVNMGLGHQFIGGHPMAGSEKSGYANASDILLENAFYLLTPLSENEDSDIETLSSLVRMTGATCVVLSPKEHDRMTALISHIPHLIAVSLVNLVRNNDSDDRTLKTFAAGGFRDITRIASSSPQMWEEICLSNADAIDMYLEEFENLIRQCRNAVQKKNGQLIHEAFETAGEYRDSLPVTNSSLLGKTYELYVNIDDRPGAIAAIAAILSEDGISIRNIGIVHNREFADGVLRIELTSARDAKESVRLLTDHRYMIARQ